MSLIQRFTRNLLGRDLVVGDVHGHFDVLLQMLKHIGFDPSKDRLFSTGDLVDRGPFSENVLRWLSYTWLHAIRGNHEQMAIGISEGRHDVSNYISNGGAWFLALEDEEQQAIAAAFRALPLAFEIETPHGTVGIVHAEPMASWTTMTALLDQAATLSKVKLQKLMEQCLWSRERIAHTDRTVRGYRDQATWDRTPIKGIDRVYVGHSTMPIPVLLGNIAYIDTGLGKGGKLTCIDLADPDNPYQL